mmetsp:Transcript_3329/g.4850  ORF Transcript_3329/g.4850 Transcript_3329/m.4850 type:complete len:469 (-) Transcript_3329:274-1680(-)|eukprot:CAMPEP_0203669176 /NCGR_PEP_ID=MMETSP0090-20130426/5618_1 /ASSEMBLY_ACC=CAM_ASM_001088 /TAXON_ID=426623 /ORGANISM="Chaetoceros affinis, Strain CCMP159" /LENGTH=468 /DNA_ID=CAMNT_0050533793 /DNA_START=482 /DNA_END=1888 /DNA_ORIENTATION=-
MRYINTASTSAAIGSSNSSSNDESESKSKHNSKDQQSTSQAPNLPNNDLAESREKMEVSKQKLREVLNDLGMSVSQWKIQQNVESKHLNQSRSTTSTRRPRMRRRKQQQQQPTAALTRRVSEEFDVYNYNYPRRGRTYKYNTLEQTEKITSRLRVRSVHAAQSIDIVAVLTKVFGSMSDMPAVRHMFGKTSVIVQLPFATTSSSSSSSKNSDMKADAFFYPQSQQPRFIAIFRFGSMVFFNISPKDASSILEQVKKQSSNPISRSFERKEHFEVAISPQMEQDAHVTSDFAMVKELNINNVAVISTIMAQTVAFDSYNDVVDEMLATFDEINSTVKKTGNFTAMQKETLFKVVAQNNSLFIDMVAKLGIKDRSDTAWNMSQYERIHEGMKAEFEIDNRFEHIEFKLNLIQQNAKFFLEILHNQKSDTLEWIIIILIGFECGLMILDMSGVGQNIFDLMSSKPPPSDTQ